MAPRKWRTELAPIEERGLVPTANFTLQLYPLGCRTLGEADLLRKPLRVESLSLPLENVALEFSRSQANKGEFDLALRKSC